MTWGSPFRWDTCSRPSKDLPGGMGQGETAKGAWLAFPGEQPAAAPGAPAGRGSDSSPLPSLLPGRRARTRENHRLSVLDRGPGENSGAHQGRLRAPPRAGRAYLEPTRPWRKLSNPPARCPQMTGLALESCSEKTRESVRWRCAEGNRAKQGNQSSLVMNARATVTLRRQQAHRVALTAPDTHPGPPPCIRKQEKPSLFKLVLVMRERGKPKGIWESLSV